MRVDNAKNIIIFFGPWNHNHNNRWGGGNIEMDECDICGGDGSSCNLLGDINSDGFINIQDIVVLINCILDNNCDECSDISNDGIINILDVVHIINIILEQN